MYLSIVSNVRNEEKNLRELHDRIVKVCDKLGKSYEVIYVENGSTDNSLGVLKTLNGATVISLRTPIPPKRTAQAAALDAGIKYANGEVIVTLDSDLQNPPEEIPKLLKKLDEGYDVVSGWRKGRKDKFFVKFISGIGSVMRKIVLDPEVHDLGCTLKAYRRECFEGLDLYGEMHRYITAILKWRGFKIAEVVTEHKPRIHGRTNYKLTKMFSGFVDMWIIWFWQKYSDRPIHLFGVLGIFITIIGTLLLCVLGVLRIMDVIHLSDSIWPLISVLTITVGLQLFIFGVVLDLLARNYFAIGREKSYLIKEIVQNS